MKNKIEEDSFEYSYIPYSTKSHIKDILTAYEEDAKETDFRLKDDGSRELNEAQESITNLGISKDIESALKTNFIYSVKPSLLKDCLEDMYNKCCDEKFCNEAYKTVKSNIVNNFITENNAGDLLRSFKYKSVMLSEYARIINKYYDRIVSESNDDEDIEYDGDFGQRYNKPVEYYIDPDIEADFFDELRDVDNEEVIATIQNRVSDAVSQFINKNTEYKLNIKDVLDATKDKISQVQSNEELDEEEMDEMEESYALTAKRQINKLKQTSETTVFERMVYNLADRVLKTESMHEQYMQNGKLNMAQIIESCELLYTFLEMTNTSKMIDVNTEFINNLIHEQ